MENNYRLVIAELAFDGSVSLGQCSRSTVTRWARDINDILEREGYEWRVKANYNEKALYQVDI